MDDFPKEPPEPKLSIVPLFPNGNVSDIPGRLRMMADDIEKGTYGTVHGIAMVMDAPEYPMFGLGKTDGASFHILLHIGMHQMVDQMIKHGA